MPSNDFNLSSSLLFLDGHMPTITTLFGMPTDDIFEAQSLLRDRYADKDFLSALKAALDVADAGIGTIGNAAKLAADLKASQEAGYAKDAVISEHQKQLKHWREATDILNGVMVRLNKELCIERAATSTLYDKVVLLEDQLA